ncbi:MAG: esterase-like activity of phytase family protein [Nodosilinea sp.]
MAEWLSQILRQTGLGRSLALVAILGLVGCAIPQVKAEDRLFLPVTAELLDVYMLPPQEFQNTTVGGLSALAYDRQTERFYALSDDRGRFGPARFYTLAIDFYQGNDPQPRFNTITLEAVTELKDAEGNRYPAGFLDPEGLALSPRNTVFISSEGDDRQNAPPLIGEYDRTSGQLVATLPLPGRFLPSSGESPSQGVQNNLSLESLTISAAPGTAGLMEPLRLFTATESALAQDYIDDPSQPLHSRFLHYLVGNDQVTLIAEHLYPLALESAGSVVNGLTELLLLDQGGHFLALERAYGLRGFEVKLYQLATGGATDTSTVETLQGGLGRISPIRKRLVLDFAETGLDVDNLEGMALGPRLADGSQSLVLVSDNNFETERSTQIILLRLRLE